MPVFFMINNQLNYDKSKLIIMPIMIQKKEDGGNSTPSNTSAMRTRWPTFAGRSPALPVILSRCKCRHYFRNLQ